MNRAQAGRGRHAERLRGGRGEVPLHPAPERAPVDHAARSRSGPGGRRSPACRRAACVGDAERRAAAASRRRPCDCRTGRARTRSRAERASGRRSLGRVCGPTTPSVCEAGLALEPPHRAAPWRHRRPVASSVAVAPGAEDRLQGSYVGTRAALAQRALSELGLGRGALRRRCRRLGHGRAAALAAGGRRRDQDQEDAERERPRRDPVGTRRRAIELYVGERLLRACARRGPWGRSGHVPLFPALTGLADGLALKELRYAGSSIVARRRFAPAATKAAIGSPALRSPWRLARRLSGQVASTVEARHPSKID